MGSPLGLGVLEAALGQLVDKRLGATVGGNDAEALDEAEFGHSREGPLNVALVGALGPETATDLRGEQEAGSVQRGEDLLGADVDAGERLLVGERARGLVLEPQRLVDREFGVAALEADVGADGLAVDHLAWVASAGVGGIEGLGVDANAAQPALGCRPHRRRIGCGRGVGSAGRGRLVGGVRAIGALSFGGRH